jgi:ribosome biogenesis protein BRX1
VDDRAGLSTDEDSDGEGPAKTPRLADKPKKTRKRKVMLMTSRGITHRVRHLTQDLLKLLPHAKKDAKYDMRDGLQAINEVAEMKNCDCTIMLECRKKSDVYMWLSKTPNGPSAKFQMANIHTMDELNLSGNCLMGSRPLLSFDAAFEESAYLQVTQELLRQMFAVPRGHLKSKPFIDHIYHFGVVDERIWFRNYQVVYPPNEKDSLANIELVEVGPRFVLYPIRVFSGSFGGKTLYKNPEYITPTQLRVMAKRRSGSKYESRKGDEHRREMHLKQYEGAEEDELADVFK